MRRFSGSLSDSPAGRINKSRIQSHGGIFPHSPARPSGNLLYGHCPGRGRQTPRNPPSLCVFCAGVFAFQSKREEATASSLFLHSNRFCLLWIYTLSTMPTQRYSISILVPPPEKKGRVTPITGRRERFMPRLMTTCQAMAANTPAQI